MTTSPATPPLTDPRLDAAAEELTANAQADATRAAYGLAWTQFAAWCTDTGRTPLPATEDTLVAYVAHLHAQGRSTSTMRVKMAAVRWQHDDAGHDLAAGPTYRAAVKGYVRTHGRAPARQARPLHATDLPRILAAIDLDTVAGVRDRALLLVGFAGGFRRGELVAMQVGHVEFHDRGVRILIPRGKSDQEGVGYRKTIPFGDRAETCPVTALRAWLDRAQIREGRVFRAVRRNGAVWGDGISPGVVARIVSDRARAAGLHVDGAQSWSGHSLRRGFATDAVEAGATAAKIREQGGWRGPVPVQYFDAGEAWDDPAAGRLGL